MKRVLVAETLEDKGIQLLQRHFSVDLRDSTSEEELCGIIPDYDGLMIKTYTRVSPAVIDAAARLRVIARAGTGLDKVDVNYARAKGIVVQNTPEANIVSVAELVFGLLLAAARRVIPADRYVRGVTGWERDQFTGLELAGRTLGIVGFGHIGKKVAARAQAFEMSVQCYDPFIDAAAMAEFGVAKQEQFDDLLRQADCITVHVPLIDATHHLFSHRQFDLMKPDAILINTARGPVVDQAALFKALAEGRIGAAGLDVFETEPPTDRAFLALDNLVVTPHIGAATHEALEKMTVQAAEVIIRELA